MSETSKRVSINQREKIKHKAKEGRKKKAKEAKKNPQWKSSASSPASDVESLSTEY